MRKVVPYRTYHGALRALDNGGRFYNLFADAKDEKLSFSELAKVAGVYSSFSDAFLHFDLATFDLRPEAKRRLVASFSTFLRAMYRGNKPKVMLPSQVEDLGKGGRTVILSGYMRFLEDREEVVPMMMISTGSESGLGISMAPIIDQYALYEISDSSNPSGRNALIANPRVNQRLPQGPLRVGGYLKHAAYAQPSLEQHKFFVDARFYSPLKS